MTQSATERILSAPIEFLRPATKNDLWVSQTIDNGWCYTFKLKSGPSFVAKMSKDEEDFTFKPLHNRLPFLTLVEWKKKKNTAGLDFETICLVDLAAGKREKYYKELYEKVLSPQPIDSDEFSKTNASFQHWFYPPMLERAVCLRGQLQTHELIKHALASSQQLLDNLLIPSKETNGLIQQKIKERRQKNG